MSKAKLKKSLEKIEKVIDDACIFLERMNLPSKSNANLNQPEASNPRGTGATSTPQSVVIGRDKDCKKIIAMLYEKEQDGQAIPRKKEPDGEGMLHEKREDGQPDTNSAQCYSIIGIHGIAGSGKSTLAQLVCEQEKKAKQAGKKHFDLIMWVRVTQNFNVDTIFKAIYNSVTNKKCPTYDNPDTLQEILKAELHGKRFLLVLDDVWCNIRDVKQYEKLQEILPPLKAGKAGSKILVTSRTEDALLALGAAKNKCIPMPVLDEHAFLELFMHYAFANVSVDGYLRKRLEYIGKEIAKKLKGSPLAAKLVGGRLHQRPKTDFWKKIRDEDVLNDTMGALWLSYQYLAEEVRRCFAYCSVFPPSRRFTRDEFVKLWAAEGFVRCTNDGNEMEDVCQEYLDELVSASFLQHRVKEYVWEEDYYTVHDLLHELAERVAGSDYFRIENHGDWTEEIPPGARHVFLRTYDAALVTKKICKLDNLRTLIIDSVQPTARVEEKVLERMFKKLKKLRVLIISNRYGVTLLVPEGKDVFSLPQSIGRLRHLRYFALRAGFNATRSLLLPGTCTKLYHMQVLDFDGICDLVFTSCEDMFGLINLRYLICSLNQKIPNIGRLTSLQIQSFTVRKEQGYELKQLGSLNKLRGGLSIMKLQNVESKAEALEAKLADKKGLKEVVLWWKDEASPEVQTEVLDDSGKKSPEIQATEVLEGLCPPDDLEALGIFSYRGLKFPSWMVDNCGPKQLDSLWLDRCSPKLGPDLLGFCTDLRSLSIMFCSWDTLPEYMVHLKSLQKLQVSQCTNILSLPELPQSLQYFALDGCKYELMSSCKKNGDPNWEKIKNIPYALIAGCKIKMGVVEDLDEWRFE